MFDFRLDRMSLVICFRGRLFSIRIIVVGSGSEGFGFNLRVSFVFVGRRRPIESDIPSIFFPFEFH